MRDVYVLLRYLTEQAAQSADLGDAAMLRDYEQSRLKDQQRVIKFCDSVVRGLKQSKPNPEIYAQYGLSRI